MVKQKNDDLSRMRQFLNNPKVSYVLNTLAAFGMGMMVMMMLVMCFAPSVEIEGIVYDTENGVLLLRGAQIRIGGVEVKENVLVHVSGWAWSVSWMDVYENWWLVGVNEHSRFFARPESALDDVVVQVNKFIDSCSAEKTREV